MNFNNMTKTQQILTKKDREKLYKLHRHAQVNMWVGIILTSFLGYISYLFIRLIYDEIRSTRYTIKDAEIIDLTLLILIFAVLALMMVWFTIFAFQRMFLSYRKKAILFKKDKLNDKKEIIRGRLIGAENRRQGFNFIFANGERISVDFGYLISGGYSITNAIILAPTEIEISRLPNSSLSFGLKYLNYQEQKQKIIQGTEKQYEISGMITLAFIFEVGLRYKYKGIIKLDRPQMLVLVGNQPIKLVAGELPKPGIYTQQRLTEYSNIDL